MLVLFGFDIRRPGTPLTAVSLLLAAGGYARSVQCYITALAHLPISDAIAISAGFALLIPDARRLFFIRAQVTGPARLALVIDRIPLARWMVAQPGPAGVSPAALFAFAAALLSVAARSRLTARAGSHPGHGVLTSATNTEVMLGAAAMSRGFERWSGRDRSLSRLSRLRRLVRDLCHVAGSTSYHYRNLPRTRPF